MTTHSVRTSSTETLSLKGTTTINDRHEDPYRPVRLLSLDGGGIRGISSILILREVMRNVNAGRDPKDELQPWQVFDLIGGTSTGGIIAIMLGRLRMTLDECLEAYTELARTIFKPKRYKYDVFNRARDLLSAKERFNSSKLEHVVKDIIRERTGNENTSLHEPSESSACKVFVTTVSVDRSDLVVLRSYDNDNKIDKISPQFQIWEAIRATSAASTYFNPFRHGDNSEYVDGAFKSNNPVFNVHHEAKDLWPDRDICLISIGTGTKPSDPLRGNALKFAKAMARLVTETESTWIRFHETHKYLAQQDMLFRYSVPDIGLVGLGDYKKIDSLSTTTQRFLQGKAIGEYITKCASKVIEIQTTDYEALYKAEQAAAGALSDNEKACLKALDAWSGDYEIQRSGIEKPVPGTCTWFLENPKYVDWLADDSASMLWVTANPGSGKTVLANFLLDQLHQTYGDRAVVCWFYFKDESSSRREAYSALCAILHQAFVAHPELIRLALSDFNSKEPSAFMDDLDGLWEIICNVAHRLGERKLICVIDALDECSEAARSRLNSLLASTFGKERPENIPPNLKFVVTSRPWPSIEKELQPLLQIRLRGEEQTEHIDQDIKKVVEHNVLKLGLSKKATSTLRYTLLQNAESTFLWVALVFENIERMPSRTHAAIKEMLEKSPPSLDQLYRQTLASLQDQEASIALLEIVLAAQRPLTVEEMGVALALNKNPESVTELEDNLEPNIESTVQRLGGFFIRIVNSTVYFVHQTARTFLQAAADAGRAKDSKTELDAKRASLRFAVSCIRLLLYESLPLRVEESSKYEKEELAHANEVYLARYPSWLRGFVKYSVSCWYHHTGEEAVSGDETELHQLIKRVCNPKDQYFNRWWPFFKHWTYTRMGLRDDFNGNNQFFAHFAARARQTAIVYGLVEGGHCNIKDKLDSGEDLVQVVCNADDFRLLEWLLQRLGEERDDDLLGTALIRCIQNRKVQGAKLLMASGIDVNATYSMSHHPKAWQGTAAEAILLRSRKKYDVEIMRALVENGLVVRDSDVIKFARTEADEILTLLLERDQRPAEERAMGLETAFREATKAGRAVCMQRIQEHSPGLVAHPDDLAIGLDRAREECDEYSTDTLIALGVPDADGEFLMRSCELTFETEVRGFLKVREYPMAQLEAALLKYFEGVITENIRAYEKRRVNKVMATPGSRLFQAFQATSLFGSSEYGKYAVLRMLTERGARISPEIFIQAFVVVIPMDGLFAAWLYDNVKTLQNDEKMVPEDLFHLACLWGRVQIMEKMLSNGADACRPSSNGVTPIMAATASGSAKAVRLLLDKGGLNAEGGTLSEEESEGEARQETADGAFTIWWRIFMSASIQPGEDFDASPVTLAKRLQLEDIVGMLESEKSKDDVITDVTAEESICGNEDDAGAQASSMSVTDESPS